MKRSLLALAFMAGCEPLELELFPVRADSGVPSPSEDGGGIPVSEPPPEPDAGESPPRPVDCLEGATSCEVCVAADDCPAGLRCHPFSGDCVQPCGPGLPDCAEESVCNPELGVCVGCTSSSQCEAEDDDEPICAMPAGECVECTNDSHCDDPEDYPECLIALGGICGCDEDGDCASGNCDLDDNRCDDDDDD